MDATVGFYERVLGMRLVTFGTGPKGPRVWPVEDQLARGEQPDKTARQTRGAGHCGSVLHRGDSHRRSRPTPERLWCRHRRRSGSANWRSWPDHVRLYPRPRRESH
ncbi:MAG: hypothetical protein ACREV9_16240 [Burkholderiales bacterium]